MPAAQHPLVANRATSTTEPLRMVVTSENTPVVGK
jgi:hypothetical protein